MYLDHSILCSNHNFYNSQSGFYPQPTPISMLENMALVLYEKLSWSLRKPRDWVFEFAVFEYSVTYEVKLPNDITVNNLTVQRKQSLRSSQLWIIGEEFRSIRTTPDYTHRYSPKASRAWLVGFYPSTIDLNRIFLTVHSKMLNFLQKL